MSSPFSVGPGRIIESSKDGVCEIYTFHVARAVSANNVAVAAVSGKRIKVISLIAQSNAAACGSIAFMSASGGTRLFDFSMPTNVQPPFILLPNMLGHFETKTGEGLYETVVTNNMLYTIQYIIYTP